MERDAIDGLLSQWSWSPRRLPLDTMAISKRITRLARHLERLAVEVLTPLGLEPGEFDVIATLLRSGPPHELTPTALNRSLMISSGGLTKRLNRVEERGLISRRLDPGDRRSLLVTLAEPGRELAETAVLAHAEATTELIERIPAAHREQLSGLLRALLLSTEADLHEPEAADPGAVTPPAGYLRPRTR
jgi:DNA-binding MarR family transcriptional regulator